LVISRAGLTTAIPKEYEKRHGQQSHHLESITAALTGIADDSSDGSNVLVNLAHELLDGLLVSDVNFVRLFG
jgi:hypothetical protein